MDDLGVPLFLEPPKWCFFCESVACYLWSCNGAFHSFRIPFLLGGVSNLGAGGCKAGLVENLHPEKRRVVFDPMLAPFPMFLLRKETI